MVHGSTISLVMPHSVAKPNPDTMAYFSFDKKIRKLGVAMHTDMSATEIILIAMTLIFGIPYLI